MFLGSHRWTIMRLRPSNACGPAQSPDRIIPEITVRAPQSEEVSMRDLATTIELVGNPIAAGLGALPDRPTEIWGMRCDNSEARERLGGSPRHSRTEGLERTIAWYREEIRHPDSSFILQ